MFGDQSTYEPHHNHWQPATWNRQLKCWLTTHCIPSSRVDGDIPNLGILIARIFSGTATESFTPALFADWKIRRRFSPAATQITFATASRTLSKSRRSRAPLLAHSS